MVVLNPRIVKQTLSSDSQSENQHGKPLIPDEWPPLETATERSIGGVSLFQSRLTRSQALPAQSKRCLVLLEAI